MLTKQTVCVFWSSRTVNFQHFERAEPAWPLVPARPSVSGPLSTSSGRAFDARTGPRSARARPYRAITTGLVLPVQYVGEYCNCCWSPIPGRQKRPKLPNQMLHAEQRHFLALTATSTSSSESYSADNSRFKSN